MIKRIRIYESQKKRKARSIPRRKPIRRKPRNPLLPTIKIRRRII